MFFRINPTVPGSGRVGVSLPGLPNDPGMDIQGQLLGSSLPKCFSFADIHAISKKEMIENVWVYSVFAHRFIVKDLEEKYASTSS